MGGRTVIVAADEGIGCPKCGHGFAVSEGISRQAIERHAEDYERTLGDEKKRLEAGIGEGAGEQLGAIAAFPDTGGVEPTDASF